jgi:hypothetical protein
MPLGYFVSSRPAGNRGIVEFIFFRVKSWVGILLFLTGKLLHSITKKVVLTT